MRIANIIIAHKNPTQLLRLIERLRHPQFDFYIHIDKKVPIHDFKLVKEYENVYFIKNRISCNWGGNSLLNAITSALNQVAETNRNYGFVNLLSAQDYPLLSPDHIYEYLLNRSGKNFISFDTSRNTKWWKEAVARYEKYHFTDLNLKGKYFFQRILNKLAPTRRFPLPLELHGSSNSTWWTITGECARYLARTLTNEKKLDKFLRYSWSTDEFVVATIIMNSEFKDQVVNNNLRYIDWSEGNAHPKLLDVGDVEKMKHSGMLFARKFDVEIDTEALDKIDKELIDFPGSDEMGKKLLTSKS